VQSVDRDNVKKSVRYVDKAGTEAGGAYTAFVLMHELRDGTYVIEDVRRGQWSALERERRLLQTAQSDSNFCHPYSVYIEQEPGSGGKESAEASVRMLKGFRAYVDKVTGSKEIRAEPYAAQVQGGNVALLAGPWNADFLDEHEVWPNGKFKDQVDAASGAFNKLATASSYDSQYRGWD
jgi:predicted phage terminase large subunit-like protein